jgi:hypothetical protein
MNALSWERDGRSLLAAGLAAPDVAWKWAAALPAYRVENALVLLDTGDRPAALAHFAAMAADGFAAVNRDIGYLYVLSRLAIAAVRLEQRDAARSLYEKMRPYAGFVTLNSLSISLGSVSHYLGVLAAFLEQPEANAHYADAVAQNTAIGHTAHARRSREALARLIETAPEGPRAASERALTDRR